MKLKLIALFSVLALVVSACGTDDTETTETTEAAETTTTTEAVAETNTIVDIAVGNEDFSTLVTALQEAGLVDTLSGEGPFTVFAPTDEAFAALPEGLLDTVLADQELLTSILTYHVVPGAVLAADVVTLDSATTVQGEDVQITVDGDTVMVDAATVVTTDIEASNGVIHVIDSVLLPPSVQEMLADGETADEEDMDEDMSGDAMNIVETAEAAGDFSTLLTAVEAAGLTETLATGGPFTVFAPTDEAFAAIDEDTLNGLLADPEALSEVLLYHVVEGEVYAADVVMLDSATTVQGSDVEIVVDGDTVTINGATVVMTDIQTSNGVIHVIDAVLLP